MALEAKRATYNLAVQAAMAALDDLMDGLDVGAVLYFIPIKEGRGLASTVPVPSTDPKRQTRFRIEIQESAANHAGGSGNLNKSNRYALGGANVAQMLGYTPMFAYITNEAGEIA